MIDERSPCDAAILQCSHVDAARFWSKIRKTETCWLWTGYMVLGYGRFELAGESVLAHRLGYYLSGGLLPALPDVLDHLCRVRPCVHPGHIEVVTLGENVLRGMGRTAVNSHLTHCLNGHPFSDANTYLFPCKSGNIGRYCRICRAARQAQWVAKRRARS